MIYLVEEKCPFGVPAIGEDGQEIFCGRGLGRQDCGAGYTCNIHPTDRWAVCCPNIVQGTVSECKRMLLFDGFTSI